MSETKKVPLGVLLSATTGCLFVGPQEGGLGAFHEFVEWFTGGPVWTHEFANREFNAVVKADILRQHPDLPTEVEATPENWRDVLATLTAKYGTHREVTPIPDYGRTKGPLETLAEIAPDKPIIAVGGA